jgi:transcriptional regulator with XRE-family HTH domain
MTTQSALFPALLKYWRHKRGLSQLDLALAAEVSARHVSFLETARAQPSQDMVLRLSATLHLPLREQNALLRAAGHQAAFPEPALDRELEAPVRSAIERMLKQHEPYPMVVMNRRYDVLQHNLAAVRLFSQFTLEPAALKPPLNVFHMLFDPRVARSFVVDWERTAHHLLSRLHVEALEHTHDQELAQLVRQLLEYPAVPESFRHPDFAAAPSATFSLRMKRDALEVGFLTTVTVFSAPGNVTLDELRLESYFPLDAATERACQELARG